MSEFRPAKKRIEVSVGESVRILRELQEPHKAAAQNTARSASETELEPPLRIFQRQRKLWWN